MRVTYYHRGINTIKISFNKALRSTKGQIRDSKKITKLIIQHIWQYSSQKEFTLSHFTGNI